MAGFNPAISMKLLSNKAHYLILLGILIVAVVIRVYNLSDRVIFDADQEFAATFAVEVLTIFPIRLIGQGLSIQSLFMGPLYFYFLVPFFALSHLHPIGGYVGSIVLGLITIIVYFLVFKSVFGSSAGIIAALLRAILFSNIQRDLLMTPAFSSDIIIVLTWFCLYKCWYKKDIYVVPLAFLFGLYSSFHPILFPFYFVLPALYVLQRHMPPKKYIVASVISFLIPLAPLIIFEYFHNFLEVKALFSLGSSGNSETKTFATLIEYLKTIFTYPVTLLGARFPETVVPIIAGLLYLGNSIYIIRKIDFWRNSFHRIVPLLTLSIFVLYYFLLPVHVPDYYFFGVFTLLFMYFVGNLHILFLQKKYVLLTAILIAIAAANVVGFYQLGDIPYSLGDKGTIMKTIIALHPDSNKQVYYDTDPGLHFGLGYLQRYYQMEATGGPGSPEYIIVIPKDRRKEEITVFSGGVGLVVKNNQK